MALGTLDRTPPPFFRQGPSSLTKLSFCSALAVFLMVADARFTITQPIRATVATMLYPLQRALLVPVETIADSRAYLGGLSQAISGEQTARVELALQAERAQRTDQLEQENARLRGLLELRPSLTVRSQAAEVLYEAADPYSRKVIIDRGVAHNVLPGSPVINEAGVLGQVTRVYLQSSEVTLLTDRDAAIPVLNSRTGARSAAFGGATGGVGLLEMRFMAGNADVQVGDLLTTSGVDGVYPPGLRVATVAKVDRKIDTGFARIVLAPAAPSDGVHHVLVLEPTGVGLPPRPQAAASEAAAAASKSGARKGARK
ncbi:MAG TPA: rod shape-determining protein MreC [Caldimonas sp.]|jgi:rod shape-determining protein MreC|nr:rod shape-determining protein MreC [Caldimonas sp.]HEX4232665.1 rod shape-determining protein MreC [Caldimonas sp.]